MRDAQSTRATKLVMRVTGNSLPSSRLQSDLFNAACERLKAPPNRGLRSVLLSTRSDLLLACIKGFVLIRCPKVRGYRRVKVLGATWLERWPVTQRVRVQGPSFPATSFDHWHRGYSYVPTRPRSISSRVFPLVSGTRAST